MAYIGLPKKEVLKGQKELIVLHKAVLENYLKQRSIKLKNRKNFFIIYEYYISVYNILNYFFLPSEYFSELLIKGKVRGKKKPAKRRKKK